MGKDNRRKGDHVVHRQRGPQSTEDALGQAHPHYPKHKNKISEERCGQGHIRCALRPENSLRAKMLLPPCALFHDPGAAARTPMQGVLANYTLTMR